MTTQLAVKQVDFLGSTLMAAQDDSGTIWAGVRWICEGIGLSKGQTDRQILNIQSDAILSKGASNLRLPTSGGNQDVWCLALDYVPLWLAKISITPAMLRDNPDAANRLLQYQLKAKDVLAAAFLPGPGSYAAMKEQIKAELLQELRTNPQIAGRVALQPGQDVWCITWHNRRYKVFRERVSRVICDDSGQVVCYRATYHGCGDRRRIYPGEIGRKTFTSEQEALSTL